MPVMDNQSKSHHSPTDVTTQTVADDNSEIDNNEYDNALIRTTTTPTAE